MNKYEYCNDCPECLEESSYEVGCIFEGRLYSWSCKKELEFGRRPKLLLFGKGNNNCKVEIPDWCPLKKDRS